jgi:hypothetical protein
VKRYEHYYWQTKGQRYPSWIAVLDCDSTISHPSSGSGVATETLTRWNLLGQRFQGGIPQGTYREFGNTAQGLWQVLSKRLCSKEQTWLFVSPSGRILSLIDFWNKLENGGIVLTGKDWKRGHGGERGGEDRTDAVCVIDDPPTVISCQMVNSPGKLLILDIRNWGIKLESEKSSAAERTEVYRSAICACVSALRQNVGCSLRCTSASQAMQALRSDDGCVAMHCHVNSAALSLERKALFGGRCECYRIGKLTGPIYHLDVRNLYPSLCLTLPLPVSLREVVRGNRSTERVVRDNASDCIADVTTEGKLPAFPARRSGNTVFPIGRFRTVLCGPELETAVKQGSIVRYHSAARYNCRPMLRTFMSRWLSLLADSRACGQTSVQSWVKSVMNGLIGKFAEPGRRWVPAPPRPEEGERHPWYEVDDNGQSHKYRNICGYTQREEIHGESYWSIPAISGFVSSAGRVRLWSYLETAGRENVWYVDTDSLICNGTAFGRLVSSGNVRDGETGYLRLIEESSSGFIHGLRHYELGEGIKCAGIPVGDALMGESRKAYWHRQRIKDEVAMGRKPVGRLTLESIPGPEVYRHGVVNPDGSVTPFEVYDE